MNPIHKPSKSKMAGAVAVALASGGACIPAAHATILTETVSIGSILSGSQSFAGSFDISALLSSNGLAGGVINSGGLSAYGFSDQSINQSSNSYTESYLGGSSGSVYLYSYGYSCGWGATCYAPVYGYAFYGNYQGTQTQTLTDSVVDSMQLQAGTATASGAVQEQVNTIYDGSYGYSRSNGTYGYDSVTVYQYTTYDTWSGGLQATANFSSFDLLSMAQSGSLSYLVSPQMGQFALNQVTLTLDVSAAPVPEPSESALLLAGLATLAAMARRRARRRAKEPAEA